MNIAALIRSSLAVLSILASITISNAQEKKLGEVLVVYDRFKDFTTVRIVPFLVQGSDANGLSLSAVVSYPGRTAPKPSLIVLQIISVSDQWQYIDGRELIFIVDGKRTPFGQDVP